MMVLAVFGPRLAPQPASYVNIFEGNLPPSAHHLLGTDDMGMGYVSLILEGIRPTMIVTSLAAAVSVFIGMSIGVIAGLARGIVAEAMARLIDLVFALPSFVLALILATAFGAHPGLQGVAIGVAYWAAIARVVRGLSLRLRDGDLLTSARLAGGSRLYIIRLYLVPNLLPTLLVFFAFQMGAVLLLELLTYIAPSGSSQPLNTLAALVMGGMQNILSMQWQLWAPTTVYVLIILAAFWTGEGLESALNRHGG